MSLKAEAPCLGWIALLATFLKAGVFFLMITMMLVYICSVSAVSYSLLQMRQPWLHWPLDTACSRLPGAPESRDSTT